MPDISVTGLSPGACDPKHAQLHVSIASALASSFFSIFDNFIAACIVGQQQQHRPPVHSASGKLSHMHSLSVRLLILSVFVCQFLRSYSRLGRVLKSELLGIVVFVGASFFTHHMTFLSPTNGVKALRGKIK